MELLIEGLRAGTNAFQACHALGTLFHNELLHKKEFSFFIYFHSIIQETKENSNGHFFFFTKKRHLLRITEITRVFRQIKVILLLQSDF